MKLRIPVLPFVLFRATQAFDYGLVSNEEALSLTDVETGIPDIKSLFIDAVTSVSVKNIEWEPVENGTVADDFLFWQTVVDGKEVAAGNMSLAGVGRQLPSSIEAGNFTVGSNGMHTVEVVLTVDKTSITVSGDYAAYKNGVSIIPLLVVLLLAVTTRMVELSLLSAVFVGACIVAGNLKDGFKDTLSVYLLEAISDPGHCYVILFTLFLSGMVGMMEKSGGMLGFTKSVARFARTARAGQFATYMVGCLIFFDDYANCLLAGETMRPLLDSLMVSREKLSFIVDATAAPIASISPISSWVGFEVDLIQTQIDRIIELEGTEDIGIKTSGLAVFLQTIKYRYYPIFMIVMMFSIIFAKRDFGPMLIAERKVTVYQRTDGGDGKGKSSETEGFGANKPSDNTPLHAHNMLLPILLLVVLIFFLLVKTGEVPGENQSLMDKIEGSDSFTALLWGTFGATMCTAIFYLLQWFKNDRYALPNPKSFYKYVCKSPPVNLEQDEDNNEEESPRPLLNISECVDSFLHGMGRIFPALIVLCLAWASGAIMIAVGADRLFSRWIVGGIPPEWLPTLSFLISLFMALATGTSWGTMSILFPLILVPTYVASDGNATIFYAVTAGVLSGSVAGDHISPISDTTVLSALASDCKLLNHVATQMPYAIVVMIISILLGTLPIGFDAWPNIVGILIGFGCCVLFTYGICAPVSSSKYDILTELRLKLNKNPALEALRDDANNFFAGEAVKEREPMNEDIHVEDFSDNVGKQEKRDSASEDEAFEG